MTTATVVTTRLQRLLGYLGRRLRDHWRAFRDSRRTTDDLAGTEKMPWLNFLAAAPFLDIRAGMLLGSVIGGLVFMTWFVLPELQGLALIVAVFVMVPGAYAAYILGLPMFATRTVVVLRWESAEKIGLPPGDDGPARRVLWDEQIWWAAKAARWPDAWRIKYNGRWTLMIDALDRQRPFRPKSNEQRAAVAPHLADTTSAAELGAVWAQYRAMRGWVNRESGMETMLKWGALVILLGIIVIGIYIGGNRLVEEVNAPPPYVQAR